LEGVFSLSSWIEKYIKPNKYSRPQAKLTACKKITIHWTANFGATAQNHFDYFNNLTDRYASAHFFVDKTQALLIVPLEEITYHANDVQQKNADGTPWRGVKELLPNANFLSVSIEMCVEKDGTIHQDTINRAEQVAYELCQKYNLNPLTDIVRHYDITHKNCPAPFVSDPSKFTAFKNAVNSKLHPSTPVSKPTVQAVGSVYTVKSGDTLSEIAVAYHTTVDALHQLNPSIQGSLIQVGEKIVTQAPPVQKPQYTVISGDTLSEIAVKEKTTVESLKALNPQIQGDVIHVGDKLNVPPIDKETSPTTTSTP
jgi:N-acetylmuramoyl-L-alanine amidase